MGDGTALITNDVVIFGILFAILAGIFYTRNKGGFWDKFYRFVPIILLCYLLPSLLVSFNIIGTENSNLWTIAKDYFLPASLVLLTLSIDLKAIMGLGSKALIMFFTAVIGIIIGGPLALLIVSSFDPTILGEGNNAAWRGLATLAGSWIGGGANQTAMLEIYQYNPENYAAMVAVDIVVANIWMAFLLYGAGNPKPIDKWLKADTSSIKILQEKIADYSASVERKASSNDIIMVLGVCFGAVGLSHLLGGFLVNFFDGISAAQGSILTNNFFWVVVLATTIGLLASFTKARELEGVGASKFGTVFIFLLVAVIGTKMNIFQIADIPAFFLIGLIWMLIHTILLFTVAKAIRAPFFFIAVGSKASVGGAASAPIVAGAFHPSLAPVGVLLAVLGYALGTYGAILCAQLMLAVSD